MATGTVRVTGLRELQRAFRKIDKGLSKELKNSLKKAAEPVAKEAQSLALTRIRNMPRSPDWAEPRIGVTAKAVYIVPSQRGGKGRPTKRFKGILLRESFDPALEAKQDEVVEAVDKMLGKLAGEAGF